MRDSPVLPSIASTITQYNLQPKKSLGQNFLTDVNITSKIARSAGDLTSHPVVEIGPGPGGLTRALLAQGATRLQCIEKDSNSIRALEALKNAYPDCLTVVNQDALTLDWTTLYTEPYKIIANLPYNISTVLLLQWLECNSQITQMTLMFQQEVAHRLAAAPGTKSYGRLSVLTQYCYDTQLEFTLPPHVFFPAPKVHSSIVNFYSRASSFDPKLWLKLKVVTRHAFSQRRKMIKNQFKNIMDNGEAWLCELGIDPMCRAEELSLATFCHMAAHFPESSHA